MKKHNTIEHQLQNSARTPVRLSDSKKNELFYTIMQSAPEQETQKQSQQHEAERTSFWKMLLMPVGVAGIAAAVFFLVVQNEETAQPAQIAQESPSAIVSLPYTDKSVPQPSKSQEILYRDFLGIGGMATLDTEWDIILPKNLSQTAGSFPSIPIEPLTTEQMRSVTELFAPEAVLKEHIKKTDSTLSTFPSKDSNECSIQEKELCVVMHNDGELFLHYDPSHTMTQEQFLEKMTTLFSLPTEHITIEEVNDPVDVIDLPWQEYNLSLNTSVDVPLPYALPRWYVGMQENTVIFVIGNVFSIHKENTEYMDIISEQEAAERFQSDVKTRTPLSTFQFNTLPYNGMPVADLTTEVKLTTTAPTLEYHHIQEYKTNRQFLWPMYRFTVKEVNTGAETPVFVDAAKKSLKIDNFYFID